MGIDSRIDGLIADIVRDTPLGEPFPNADCSKACKGTRVKSINLITALDLYCADIAGHYSWGSKLLDWPPEKMKQVNEKLKLSFFERHPSLAAVRFKINAVKTPQLERMLSHYESLRLKLKQLFGYLLAE